VNRARIILVVIAAVLLTALSFEAGRQSIIPEGKRNTSAKAQSIKSASRTQNRQPDLEDDHKILIQNSAMVPFTELYDLLRSVSPKKRSEWAKELDDMPAGRQKFSAIEAFYKTFVQVDPEAAVHLALAMTDHRVQSIAADAIAGAAPESAMGEVTKMGVQMRPPYLGGLNVSRAFFRWSRVDPVAASRFAEEHPKDVSLDDLLYNWSAIDLAAARAWLGKQDKSSHHEEAISGLLSGWEEIDRAGALGYAAAHGTEKEFQLAIKNLASTVFLDSPEQARAFVNNLPSDESKRIAIGEIKSITTGVILGGSPDWPRPPELVAKWMVAFPKEIWRDEIGSVIEMWANENADGLVAWMNQLPEDRRNLIEADYCMSVDKREPERAIAVGMRITDKELREQTLGRYLGSFGRTREEAVECLARFKLSSKEKAYLAKLIPDEEE
jgi:hypothetical protein